MRHKVFGKKLGRDKDERKALFRNLVSELVMHGRIKTTETKAKAIRPLVEKLVTKAKKATIAGKRDIFGQLSTEAAQTLINIIVPKLATRTSGFSRIIHVGGRNGDNAQVVIMEWVEQIMVQGKSADKSVVKEKKTATKKVSAKAETKEEKIAGAPKTKKRTKKA